MPTGSTFFCLTVTVKEGRPVPEIEILPYDKCIEYELNKRYVYKYDGEFHLPKKYNAYDPEFEDRDHPELRFLIMTSDVIGSAVNGTVVKGVENCEKFVDVGIYKFVLYVYNPLDRFAPAQIRDVIVEIVE